MLSDGILGTDRTERAVFVLSGGILGADRTKRRIFVRSVGVSDADRTGRARIVLSAVRRWLFMGIVFANAVFFLG